MIKGPGKLELKPVKATITRVKDFNGLKNAYCLIKID